MIEMPQSGSPFVNGRTMLFACIGIALAVTMAPALADTITGNVGNNTAYNQTSNSAPTTASGYFFGMYADFSTPGDFTSGTATYPGPDSPQGLSPAGDTRLLYQTGYYSSLALLHADYPFGTYTINATGPAGNQTANIDYSADYFTSDVPYITNFSSLAGSNPAQTFTFYFPAYTPNPATDTAFIFLTISDASGGVYSADFLPPNSTSVTLPANTLLAYTDYTFELNYSNRITGYDSLNETLTNQLFENRTDGAFRTGGAFNVPEPPTLGLFGLGVLLLGGFLRLRQRGG